MKGDTRYGKFFIYLSLFTSAMLGLVLSDNLLSVFIFWELMGFCSYSLIGFYMEKEKAGDASIKAFMTTRVGDVCFLLGILAIWSVLGNVGFVDIYKGIAQGAFVGRELFGLPLLTVAGICIFLGTIGKSAQFPLQVWLPDAMMGPTPCSALIHAATMVAAGVYLSLRMYPIMVGGDLSTFIAFIGAITALGAATMALIQTDLKGVLAFSTISQLGYMVIGVGVGSYNASFMHLITHAVFKACLFLAAGSVIHSLHDHHTHEHVQDMRRMGGLRKKMPFTFLAMMVCSLAIAGVPFFSGFVSKDRILGDALYWGLTASNKLTILVPMMGFTAALLTAFYMFRMMFLTFFGKPRDQDLHDHCHEEHLSFNQNIPLLILSFLSLAIFYSGSLDGAGVLKVAPQGMTEWFKVLVAKPETQKFVERQRFPLDFTAPQNIVSEVQAPVYYDAENDPDHHNHLLHSVHVYGAFLSILIALIGILMAWFMYGSKKLSADWWAKTFASYKKVLEERYYFDHFYVRILIGKGLLKLNDGLSHFDMKIYDKYAIDGWAHVSSFLYRVHRWFDENVIDMLVDFTGVCSRLLNVILRTLQSGRLQFYLVIFLLVLGAYICIF
jgi:NADH-quinone oxidoreductase subunit L